MFPVGVVLKHAINFSQTPHNGVDVCLYQLGFTLDITFDGMQCLNAVINIR